MRRAVASRVRFRRYPAAVWARGPAPPAPAPPPPPAPPAAQDGAGDAVVLPGGDTLALPDGSDLAFPYAA